MGGGRSWYDFLRDCCMFRGSSILPGAVLFSEMLLFRNCVSSIFASVFIHLIRLSSVFVWGGSVSFHRWFSSLLQVSWALLVPGEE